MQRGPQAAGRSRVAWEHRAVFLEGGQGLETDHVTHPQPSTHEMLLSLVEWAGPGPMQGCRGQCP